MTDGAGVTPPPTLPDGVDAEIEGWEVAGDGFDAVGEDVERLTMNCSPFVIGMLDRVCPAEVLGSGLGG